MSWRYLYYLLVVIFIWLVQTSFISVLPAPANHLNLSLVILIILLLFDDLNLLFFWIILSAYLASLTSSLPLTLILLAMLIVMLLAYFILNQFLTNKSLYSLLLLTLGATVLSELFIFIGTHVYNLFTGLALFVPLTNSYFINLFYSVTLNCLGVITLFYSLNTLNSKLKPFLLVKRKN